MVEPELKTGNQNRAAEERLLDSTLKADSTRQPHLPLDCSHLRAGQRLGVGVSGGADSVALLRVLHERAADLGLVLYVAHLHHGLRGQEADADLDFVRNLAGQLALPFHFAHVDVGATVKSTGESTEEAARRLRYAWFRQLMKELQLQGVATAHTADDQAETVLARLLRGAWTEGLAGVYPVVRLEEGQILRPLLAATRTQVEAYLGHLQQPWREDSSNQSAQYTRNRIRHQLLPELESWNPKLREKLGQMAELAREEEHFWQVEVERVASQLILRGRAVRGGGRAAAGAEGIALDVTRLIVLKPALERRLIRYAVEELGSTLDFAATESIRHLAREGKSGQKLELAGNLRVERSPRELHLAVLPAADETQAESKQEQTFLLPAMVRMDGLRLILNCEPAWTGKLAVLRPWKPGDRVRLRYSSGPRKVKEVLERMKITGSERVGWPVLEVSGLVVWMKGAEVEPEPGLMIKVERSREVD